MLFCVLSIEHKIFFGVAFGGPLRGPGNAEIWEVLGGPRWTLGVHRGSASINNKLIGSSEDTDSFGVMGRPASIRNKLIGSSKDIKSFCVIRGPASIRNKLIGSPEETKCKT